MANGSGILRVMTGVTVERRVIWVPQGLAVGPAVCAESPDDCCGGSGSGSGVGCCDAPDTLFATLFTDDPACECLPACVVLDRLDAFDAWFSLVDVGIPCGSSESLYLRLQCRDGVWALDVVEGHHGPVIALAGAVDQGDVTCDPFYLAADFDDTSAELLCGGTFAYVISESDCTGTSGGVENDCCPDDPTPATLYATFGGALAGLGTVTLTATGGLTNQWVGNATGACGDVQVTFLCLMAPNFSMGVVGDSACSFEGLEAATCAPFLWEASGVSTGTCAGACDVSVSDSPP